MNIELDLIIWCANVIICIDNKHSHFDVMAHSVNGLEISSGEPYDSAGCVSVIKCIKNVHSHYDFKSAQYVA